MTQDSTPPAPRSIQELLLQAFQANDGFLSHAVADFDEADWAARHGETNCAAWILGHLASSRRACARIAGCSVPQAPWEARFEMGSTGEIDGSLTVDDLQADFVATGLTLCEQLGKLSAADIAKDAPLKSPTGYKDIASVLMFLQFHESYHIGQLGMIRRLQGKSRFA